MSTERAPKGVTLPQAVAAMPVELNYDDLVAADSTELAHSALTDVGADTFLSLQRDDRDTTRRQ